LKGESAAFIMELPLYHQPNLRTIGMQVWHNSIAFLKKAGSLILAMAVLMWALSTQTHGQVETSYLATFGRWLEPAGAWLGLDWKMLVALLTSFVAKENSIATLSILYGAGQSETGLAQLLGGAMRPAAALSFLVVQMLFIPCAATVSTIRQESHSWKWTIANVLGLLIISLGMGVLVYQVARWITG
jgi:ferrous iron transport protein B